MKNPDKKLIYIISSGLDEINRGYETHQKLLFESLSKEKDIEARLIKRSGARKTKEIRMLTPSRNSLICKALSCLTEDASYWENFFFTLAFYTHILYKKSKPTYIFLIEPGVSRTLSKLSRLIPEGITIYYTHGIANQPQYYFWHSKNIIEVNIENYLMAQEYKQRKNTNHNINLIPHFYVENKETNLAEQDTLSSLNITTPYVALCVGVINEGIKRTNYLISEFENNLKDWTLIICGKIEEQWILDEGSSKLGERLIHLTLPKHEMHNIYRKADIVILASINEGFGYTIIEAMSYGRPVLLHDCKRNNWIIKDNEQCIDMTKPGSIRKILCKKEFKRWRKIKAESNLKTFNSYYSWHAVREKYLNLIY